MIWTCARIQGRVACALTGLVEVVRRSTPQDAVQVRGGAGVAPGACQTVLAAR